MKCFFDWNIDRKLTCITVDNCTTNDLAIRLLVDKLGGGTLLLNGSFFHMRCCAHILHLIVKDGMHVLGSGIERIRQSVIFWSATPKRWERFEEAARQLWIPTINKLCGDVRTRWNSTFFMLRIALPYKDVFSRCVQLHQDPLYKSLPTEDDWVFATEICEKFKLFYDITEDFSGTKYATTNLYFLSICKIRVSLNEWKMHTNDTISSMTNCMLEKFEKYWSNVNGIIGVATLLDPRYKTPLLEYYFEKIFGVVVAEYEVEKIVQLCRDLVLEYEEKANSSMNYSQSSCTTSSSSVPVTLGDQSEFEAYLSRKKQKKLQVKSELDRYLELELLPSTPEFDILNWWKINGPQFPILKDIASDIFAIPVSTVASESTFSTGGRLVTAHRNRLLPSTVEALACSQNWLWAEEESNSSEAYFNEDGEIEQEEIMSTALKEAIDDLEWPGSSIQIVIQPDPPCITFKGEGHGDLQIGFTYYVNTDLVITFHCDRQVSYRYKYKFLRAITLNLPSSVIKDNRGSKLTIGRGRMLKVQHLVSVARAAASHPHIDFAGHQAINNLVEFLILNSLLSLRLMKTINNSYDFIHLFFSFQFLAVSQ